MLVKIGFLLQEYGHIGEHSTLHYLTAVNKSQKETFEEIEYDTRCMNIQNNINGAENTSQGGASCTINPLNIYN